MMVKGSAVIGRQKIITSQFGEAAWADFIAEIAESEPIFREAVLAVTQIPATSFIAFNHALISRFFDGDPEANWQLGEKSAEWALREGPYRSLLGSRDFQAFAETAPKLWTAYYDAGNAQTAVKGNTITITIKDCPLTDVYFEYATLGYFKGGLELAGGKVMKMRCLAGFSKGDKHIHYEFIMRQ